MGIPLGIAAAAFLGLYFNERRARKRLERTAASMGIPQTTAELQGVPPYSPHQHLFELEGRTVINLQSVLIGNGITDISTHVSAFVYLLSSHSQQWRRLYPGRYAIECENAAIPVPFQSITNCVRMKKAVSPSRHYVALTMITERPAIANVVSSRVARG